MALDAITRQEFDHRLDAANARLRQELADAKERVRLLDELIRRKEAFVQKLDRVLAEIEHDEADIAAVERELRPRRSVRRPPKHAA
jgi:hypothetical protein